MRADSDTTTFRFATAADVHAILPHMAVFNAEEQINFDPERGRRALTQLLAHPTWGFVLLAERDIVLGYALVSFGFDIEFGGREAFLTELFVAREHRGRRIGQGLLDAVEGAAREAGASAIHLSVRVENVRAVGLYEKSGFVRDPRPLMTKSLRRG